MGITMKLDVYGFLPLRKCLGFHGKQGSRNGRHQCASVLSVNGNES